MGMALFRFSLTFSYFQQLSPHRIQLKKLAFDYEKFTLPLKATTDQKVSSNLMIKKLMCINGNIKQPSYGKFVALSSLL